jgi:hypothetical protein
MIRVWSAAARQVRLLTANATGYCAGDDNHPADGEDDRHCNATLAIIGLLAFRCDIANVGAVNSAIQQIVCLGSINWVD